MTGQGQTHQTNTTTITTSPVELDAGADLTLKVRISCESGCDLQGASVRIVDPQAGVVGEYLLANLEDAGNETDELLVQAPSRPGEYTWTVVFPTQERQGAGHEESSASLPFVVRPHATTVAVWDTPPMVALGEQFCVKVGVKCSHGCVLAGSEIEVFDREGTKVASAILGDTPASAAADLYCAEVELSAPEVESRYRWTVRFPQQELELSHAEESCSFAFGTVMPSEHVLTIEVVDKETEERMQGADVLLRPRAYRGSAYRARTNADGVARISVPAGDYQLYVSSSGKEVFKPMVVVQGDLTIGAELAVEEVRRVGPFTF